MALAAVLAGGAAAQAQEAKELLDAGMWRAAEWKYKREEPDRLLGLEERNAKAFREGKPAEVRLLPLELQDEYYYEEGQWDKVRGDSPYRPHADYHSGYEAYAEGDYAKAREAFKRIEERKEYKAIVPYYMLQIEFLDGNYAYVTEHAPELIANTAMPRRAELMRMAAQAWFRQGEHEEALAYIEDYMVAGGEMARDEWYLTGFSLYQRGRLQEAAAELAKATGPDDALSQNASYHLADIYLRLGERQKAMQGFSIAATSDYDPDITRDAMLSYGKLLFETGGGRFNETVNVLTKYVEDYPDEEDAGTARDLLVAAYYNARDYGAAYEAIVQLEDPDNTVKAALQKITYFRALELWEEGDGAGAMELLEESSKYRYNAKYTALAEFWKGEIMYEGGDYRGAVPHWEEYLKLSPTTERENVMARYALGYAEFNQKNWDEAKRWLDDFLARHPARDAYRADALNRQGDINHAKKAYWRAIESYDAASAAAAPGSPGREYAAYQRAMMLGLVERPDRKIESLEAIIKAGRGMYVEEATYELGQTYITQERYAEGARVLGGFVRNYPESQRYTDALMGLGLANLNMGKRDESLKYYEQVVARAPYSPEAQAATRWIHDIYVEKGDSNGFFAWAKRAEAPVDGSAEQREEFAFAAAQSAYLSGDGRRAEEALKKYAADYPRGVNIATVLGYLAEVEYKAEKWAEARDVYGRLAEVATDAVVRAKAEEGRERSARKADAERARRTGGAEAVEVWKKLAGDVRTAEGAEGAYRVIEWMEQTGDTAGATEGVFAMAESGTPHGYWLGKAFLVLGKIYAGTGDTFQARATYQSIVDGYMPADDGIVDEAKKRIAEL